MTSHQGRTLALSSEKKCGFCDFFAHSPVKNKFSRILTYENIVKALFYTEKKKVRFLREFSYIFQINLFSAQDARLFHELVLKQLHRVVIGQTFVHPCRGQFSRSDSDGASVAAGGAVLYCAVLTEPKAWKVA